MLIVEGTYKELPMVWNKSSLSAWSLMIFVLWTIGVEPTGTLYGLALVNTLNGGTELRKNKNIRGILHTLVAWSSCSGSGTVVTRDFGSSV